jgi:DNA gyrase subunit A
MANVDLKDVIEESFIQYSGAVLQSRALLDVRDCLKPSARQIFYCLYTDNFLPSKPFKKTLKAIGAIARLYIHGDASAEGVIMRAGQPFAMRYPLMEIEGNAGNLIETGNWGAPRYTSSRLSEVSTQLFEDVNKNTIDEWRDNYDDTEKYPSVLPSKGFYNIVNGTLGIGIGVSSSIPQFNLREVNNALATLLKHPDCDFNDIYCIPDFATGGFLINEPEVKESLKKGTGAACALRAKIDYDKGEHTLKITEIPYGVYTNTICEELEAIIEDGSCPDIDKFIDLTGEQPLIEIYLTPNAKINKVISFLYKNTSLQYYYGINMTMLDNGRFPKVYGWREALQAHINHEKSVYRKGFEFDLNKIKERIHILDGLLICLNNIDAVVKIIKESVSTTEAKIALQNKFKLDRPQVDAILNMKLSRLAHLETEKLIKEKEELDKEAKRIEAILSSESALNNVLIQGWEDVANKYGDERRTKVITIEKEKEEEELPEPAKVVVILEESGNIKRVPLVSFKISKRNSKGIKTKEDTIISTISTNTIDTLTLFTDKGKMYRYSVNDIPDDTKGVSIYNLIDFAENEKVIAATSLYRNSKAKYVVFITKNGMIKKTAIEEYGNGKMGKGITALKLSSGDSLANVTFIDDEQMIVVSKKGYAIRFETKGIAPVGRAALGVKAIGLVDNDEVLIGIPIHKESDDLATFTDNGIAKKTALSEFPIQQRAGRGLLTYKASESTGNLIGAATVDAEDHIIITGQPNSTCVAAKEIPSLGRVSIGVKMIKDSKVLSITKI